MFAVTAYAASVSSPSNDWKPGQEAGSWLRLGPRGDQVPQRARCCFDMDDNYAGVATRARSLLLKVLVSETPGDTPAIECASRTRASIAHFGGRMAGRWSPFGTRGVIRSTMTSRLSHVSSYRVHEAYFMARRAIFGLERWSELPEAGAGIVVRDLVGTGAAVLRLQGIRDRRRRYRTNCCGKIPAERDDIRAAVMASGRGTKTSCKHSVCNGADRILWRDG